MAFSLGNGGTLSCKSDKAYLSKIVDKKNQVRKKQRKMSGHSEEAVHKSVRGCFT